MVLMDVDRTLVWQTNTTSYDVAAARLLKTGNLVLQNKKGDVLWQSFDSPMNTLLPSQPFTKNTRLTSDEREVAVKKLGDVFQAEEEYFAEISTIGKMNHMHLVKIWGFCSERRHRLVVYEYHENFSLDRHVFGSNFLSWKQRYAVALGTAKGLAYLHHECLEWMIHCDVKPENILLDSDFQPKIADFGLAKLLQREGEGSEFTRMRGTRGYMAPEWALGLPITSKVDVFGYGVVLLELVRGLRLSNWVDGDGDEEGEGALSSFVRRWKGEVEVDEVVDKRLEGRFGRRQAAALIQVGVDCVEENRNKRPTLATVIQTLMACEYDE